MRFSIRAAAAADGPALQAIERAAGEQFRDIGMDAIADDDPWSLETLAAYAAAGRSWVALGEGGGLIGYVIAIETAGLDVHGRREGRPAQFADLGDIDEAMLASLTSWYALGWRSLDGALAELGAGAAPSTIQIWPEHFDAAVDIAVAPGRRVNLGASPGDAFSGEPYLYVGPWGPERPGGPGYWNAPFGACLGRSNVPDVAAGVAFLLDGVSLLRT